MSRARSERSSRRHSPALALGTAPRELVITSPPERLRLSSAGVGALSIALAAIVVAASSSAAAQASGLGSPAPPGSRVETVTPTAPTPRQSDPPPASAGYESQGTLSVPPAPIPTAPVYPGATPYPGASLGPGALHLGDAHDGVRIPSVTATRLRALDAAFQTLAARGGGGNVVDGVLGILTGGAAVTIGGVLLGEGDETQVPLAAYLFVYGGVGLVRGVLSLVLMSDPSGAQLAFAQMPMANMDDVRARLEYGEHELASLADRARLARILDACLNIGAGLAFIPAYLGPNDFALPSDLGWFVLIGAGISVVGGIVGLFTVTEAERRWSAYEQLRDRLERGGDVDMAAVDARSVTEARGEIAPVAGASGSGAIFGLAGTF